MEGIQVYGTRWCPDCFRAKQVLERHKVPYTWIDIEADTSGLEYVREVNHGYHSVPTLVFPDGSILVEPSNPELEARLKAMT